MVDNSAENFEFIAEGTGSNYVIINEKLWSDLTEKYNGKKEEFLQFKEKVSLGLKEAYRKMVIFKQKQNSPLIVSRNGKVISIPDNEILPTTKGKDE